MPKLNGSKTHDNLKEAFAGESQANRRYLYFAQKADVEGYPDVAALFRSVAEGETDIAHAASVALCWTNWPLKARKWESTRRLPAHHQSCGEVAADGLPCVLGHLHPLWGHPL